MDRHTRSHASRALHASRAFRLVVLYAAGLLLLSACSSAHAHEQTESSTTTAAPGTNPSVRCRSTLTPGDHDLTMVVGGRVRVLIAHVPSGRASDDEPPLVVDMHGS